MKRNKEEIITHRWRKVWVKWELRLNEWNHGAKEEVGCDEVGAEVQA